MQATNRSTTPVRLDVLNSAAEVRHTCEFVKEKIVLGRILSADMRIDDPRVSRIHALLEVRGSELLLTDLASTHGTFVNGYKIVESKVKVGDVIRLGTVEIRLEKGSGKTFAQPVPSEDGISAYEGDETQLELDRSILENMNRRGSGAERRKHDAFPDEQRLEERRVVDRRADERRVLKDRRVGPSGEAGLKKAGLKVERRKGPRREEEKSDRRVGERRRKDRRVFDITSLERRIADRRRRVSDDDLLPEELEAAFESVDHARELEVTVLWGDHILDVSNYADAQTLTVGESPRNTYIIPSVGISDEFPLVTIEEDGSAQLAFTEKMTGTVRARDQLYSISDLTNQKFVKKSGQDYSVTLKQDDFAKLKIGNINFFILYVKPAPRIKPAPLFDRDKLFLRTFIGSFLLMMLLMIGISLIPEPTPVTIEMMPERFAKIVIKKKPTIKLPDAVKAEKTASAGSKAAEGTKAPEPEGKPKADTPKVEKKEPPKKTVTKPTVVAKTPVRTQAPQKQVDTDQAKSVGLLKAFKSSSVKSDLNKLLNNNQAADVFGKNWRATRGKESDALGGASGQGLQGVNVGGGGKTIGIEGPSTKGLGGGAAGEGVGEGLEGTGRLGKKGEASVNIVSENIQVLSGLPKDVIDAVVQRHRNEIRQCYEAARQQNPSLRGKIVVKFTIQPNGIVSFAGIADSSVGDRGLEGCITSRVRTWQFPKPEAPVVTEVSAYPFFLNPGN